MSETMLIVLYVLAGLTVLFLLFVALRAGKNFYKVKNVKPIDAELVDTESIETKTEETVETTKPVVETVETTTETPVVPETFSEVKEETEDVKEETEVMGEVAVTETVDTKIEEVEETEEDKDVNVIKIGEIEDDADVMADKLNIKRVHFAQKLLKLDEHTWHFYDEIYNKFNSYRNVNIRLSFKHVTFRFKRKLIAKLTIKGKTLKLHLALDVNAFNKNVYFQSDLKGVKAYEEVPFTVKVKSARGLKNALNLISILCEKEGVEAKARFKKVNSLKEIMQSAGIK